MDNEFTRFPSITDGMIENATHSKSMAKAGYSYFRQGHVRLQEIDSEEGMAVAWVTGSRTRPYETMVILLDDEDYDPFYTTCTCPVGGGCKHGAALLYFLQYHQNSRPEAPEPRKSQRPRLAITTISKGEEQAALSGGLTQWLAACRSEEGQRKTEPAPLSYVLSVKKRDATPAKPKGKNALPLPALPMQMVLKAQGLVEDAYHGRRSRTVWPSELQHGRLHLTPLDCRLLLRMSRKENGGDFGIDQTPEGPEGWQWLQDAAATGRLVWNKPHGGPLAIGQPKSLSFVWLRLPDQRLVLSPVGLGPGAILLASNPPCIVDPVAAEIFQLDLPMPPENMHQLLLLPPLSPMDAIALAENWGRLFGSSVPVPPRPSFQDLGQITPTPVLTFLKEPMEVDGSSGKSRSRYRYAQPREEQLLARLSFRYADYQVDATTREAIVRAQTTDGIVHFTRDLEAEQAAVTRLEATALVPIAGLRIYKVMVHQAWDHMLLSTFSDIDHFELLAGEVAELGKEGWQIAYASNWPIRYQAMDEESPGLTSLARGSDASGIDWFDIGLEALVDGERVDILPALRTMLSKSGDQIRHMADTERLILELGDGQFTSISLGKLRPLLEALLSLALDTPTFGKLAASRHDLSLLAGLGDTGLTWTGAEDLRRYAHAMVQMDFNQQPAPKALQAELRAYQHTGLNWLQALRVGGFGGILADDMGLGKTVQTIAHMLAVQEIEQGQVLIVCPTSVIPNWQAELARFAPHVTCLTWHGAARSTLADQLDEAQVVLTSYPLLSRDKAIFLGRTMILAVFDEAHVLKNPATTGFQTAIKIKAAQVLALSGTPVENRLSDLWALATLTNPGLLGSLEHFRTVYRKPIENDNDARARSLLARKVQPFLLRRTKEEVAKDLPPKTVMSEWVEMGAEQMSLYESQRVLMQAKVRDEIARVGLMRSQIILLDAMLKLRQICCDPTLLKAHRGKTVSSAKRERLLTMLTELLSEGRRILLFSQFTSMLDLLKVDLTREGIEFCEIRGDTKDRATPVTRFQNGDVPVILVSLKAGGTGLNLTRADTVILYDPWWNPAVEAQAIDRAHRIGQNRPVFVYRLIARGSIEEKILILQDKKRALADLLWSDGKDQTASKVALTDEDIDFLLGNG